MIIVTSIYGSPEVASENAIKALSYGSDMVEFRLDLIWDDLPEMESIRKLVKKISNRSILTWRSKKHGGRGRLPESIWLRRLGHMAKLIDIEYEFAIKGIRFPNSIVSWHDPSGTPNSLRLKQLVNSITKLGGLSKIVTYAERKVDAYRVLKLYREVIMPEKLIAFSMGNKGSFSRRIAPFLGSPIMYAYLDKPVAEGQVSLKEALLLKELLS